MMNPINLAPASHQAHRRQQKHLQKITLVVVGYLSLVAIAYIGIITFGGSSNKAIAAQLEQTEQECQTIHTQISKLMPTIKESQMTLEASRAVSVHPNWGALLSILAQESQQKIVMKNIFISGIEDQPKTMTPKSPIISTSQHAPHTPQPQNTPHESEDQYTLSLQAYALTQNDVTDFVLRLENLALFDRVTLVETKQQNLGTGRVFYCVITCDIGPVKEKSNE